MNHMGQLAYHVKLPYELHVMLQEMIDVLVNDAWYISRHNCETVRSVDRAHSKYM